jgi:hypothetical protein
MRHPSYYDKSKSFLHYFQVGGKMPQRRRQITIGIGMIVAILLVVLVVLSLLGPAIGNVFSNIVVGFNPGITSPVPSIITPIDDLTPMITETQRPTLISTFTPTSSPPPIPISAEVMQTATALAQFFMSATPNETQIALAQTQGTGGSPLNATQTRSAQQTATIWAITEAASGSPLNATQTRSAQQTATIWAITEAASGFEPDETEVQLVENLTATAQAPLDNPTEATREFLPESTPEATEEAVTTAEAQQVFCGDNVCLPDEVGICAADCGGTTYTPVPIITFTPIPTKTPGGNLPDTGGGGFAGIGSSSVYVFHDKTVRPKQQTVVELKLFFDAVFITATPTSARTAIPVTQNSPRPNVDVDATSTPRSAVYSEDAIQVSDRLIAVLECGSAFVDCGAKPVLPLSITQPNEWLWQITPADGVQGKQTLTLELWTVGENDQPGFRLWTYAFEIEVLTDVIAADNNTSPVWFILTIAGIAGLALIGGVLYSRRQPATKKKIGVALENAPRVFISYRRAASAGYGQILHDKLAERGAEIFLDVRDLHAGEFGEDLKESIATCDYFLLLLAPTTLESQWVVKEVEYAREKGKIIIPVLINEFDLYGNEMPEKLKWLQQQNAIPMPHLYVDAAVEKIAEFIGLPESG